LAFSEKDKMKILVISNNLNRASFRQRIGIYLDILRKNGMEYEVTKLPSNYFARRKLFKRGADFDAVFLHKKCLNSYDAYWLKRYSRKLIYDLDDAVMYSTQAPASDRTSHFKLFRRTASLADMIIAGNSYLAEHARKFNSNVRILPTGLDVGAYKAKVNRENDDKVRLIWIGSRSTLRYLIEIRSALEEIGSRFGNVVLRIVCDEFFDLEHMRVEKHPWSLETQAIDLVASDIGLAPLPNDRFTRGKCGFKILQYAAAGLPAVTSPVGVNSDYVQDGVTGFLAADTRQWVERVTQLIEDRQLRKNMGVAARKWVKNFDSEVLGKRLCDFICSCIRPTATKRYERSTVELAQATPTVSICIPTYNRRDYLRETLDSVLAQTYKDYEIVIVDDGSTDGTEDMIKELGIPVTYHWQENSGDAAARNKLVELARGEYISFIDSDDLLLPDAIERMVEVMKSERGDIVVYGSYLRIDQDGKIYGRCKRKLYSGDITKRLFQTIFVHCCGSMLPKKLLDGSIAFDTALKVCSDYDFWLCLSLDNRFIALPEPTFKRRRHPDNLSGPSFENCLTELRVLERFYFEKDGKKAVPEKIAMKVFSKEGRRTGRSAIREGTREQACELLWQSFTRYPNFKSLIHWVRAMLMGVPE
jgi:glycosyltransferase involved in cell wall biosynthesis